MTGIVTYSSLVLSAGYGGEESPRSIRRLDTEAFGGAELFDLFADPSGIPKKERRGRPGNWWIWLGVS